MTNEKNGSNILKYAFVGIVGGMILTACLVVGVKAYISHNQPYVEINGKVFYVEIADTEAKRRLGLMFRKRLADNHGMLFIFDKPAIQTFWMKNTYIPLDIIFIDADHKIINIATMPPETTQTCSSRGPAMYVLEISAGLCKKLRIKPGDKVIFANNLKSFIK